MTHELMQDQSFFIYVIDVTSIILIITLFHKLCVVKININFSILQIVLLLFSWSLLAK